jgi:SAM-dependent methyltransferase
VRCDSQQERRHYEKHNNDLGDAGYRDHLLRLVTPIVQLFKGNSRGLDYGCGPIISIGQLFKDQGIICDSYDPLFSPQMNLIKKEAYDFITCCEVVEHFKSPREEFETLLSMLKPSGCLIISTHTIPEGFEDWWYQRDPTHIVFYSTETFSWIATNYEVSFKEIGDNLFLFSK